MKTNKLIELYHALEAAVEKGDLNFKIAVFKNIKVIEDLVQPILKSKEIIEKMLDDYRSEVNDLIQKYGENDAQGRLNVLQTIIVDGEQIINPKFNEYSEEFKNVYEKYKKTIEKYNLEVTNFELLMKSEIEEKVFKKLKFIEVAIDSCPNFDGVHHLFGTVIKI